MNTATKLAKPDLLVLLEDMPAKRQVARRVLRELLLNIKEVWAETREQISDRIFRRIDELPDGQRALILLDHNLVDVQGDEVLQMIKEAGLIDKILAVIGTTQHRDDQEYLDQFSGKTAVPIYHVGGPMAWNFEPLIREIFEME